MAGDARARCRWRQPLAGHRATVCGQRFAARADTTAEESSPRFKVSPTIIPLSSKTLSKVVPYSGTGDQVVSTLGGVDAWARRLGLSLAGTFAFYNVSIVLTALASLFWVWSPILGAASTNTGLRLRFKYAGVWKAHILRIQPGPAAPENAAYARWDSPSVSEKRYSVLVGDRGGATIEVSVPAAAMRAALREGEPAEVLVLSDRPNCSRFKAVRDVFLPGRKLWLSQDHNIEHAVFEHISSRLGEVKPLGDSPLVDDLDAVYNARVFEMDLSPARPEKDELHHRQSPDRFDGEHIATFSDGSEALSSPDMNAGEDWLAPEVDLLPRETSWER